MPRGMTEERLDSLERSAMLDPGVGWPASVRSIICELSAEVRRQRAAAAQTNDGVLLVKGMNLWRSYCTPTSKPTELGALIGWRYKSIELVTTHGRLDVKPEYLFSTRETAVAAAKCPT
jgi:hypothetical protein